MKKVIVIDDELHIREMIVDMLTDIEEIMVVGSCGTVEEGVVLIRSCNPDIVCLDIHLSDGTGFDILKQLETVSFKTVFITAYSQHAIKAIKHKAFDYILKPIDEDELISAINKAVEEVDREDDIDLKPKAISVSKDRLTLRFADKLRIVEFSSIIYCESDNGYTTFHLNGGETLVSSRGLKHFEDVLPQTSFVRVHKSFLVNIQYILEYNTEGVLVLKNKQEVPVATRRKEFVLNLF